MGVWPKPQLRVGYQSAPSSTHEKAKPSAPSAPALKFSQLPGHHGAKTEPVHRVPPMLLTHRICEPIEWLFNTH